jgi:hypothetical protein
MCVCVSSINVSVHACVYVCRESMYVHAFNITCFCVVHQSAKHKHIHVIKTGMCATFKSEVE